MSRLASHAGSEALDSRRESEQQWATKTGA
jgi:hypothetical protein